MGSHQILSVTLRLGELHYVHTLPCVPMQERAALEHQGKLVKVTPEKLLHAGGIRQGYRCLRLAHRGHRTKRHGHVVGDPSATC